MVIEDLNEFRKKLIRQYKYNNRSIKYLANKHDVPAPVISFLIASAGVDTKKYVKAKEVRK